MVAGAVLAGLLALPGSVLAGKNSFHGVVPQQALGPEDVPALRDAGVDSVRLLFNWSRVEPERGRFDFGPIDAEMRILARARVEAVPFVYGTPTWLERQARRPPLRNRKARTAWRRVLRKLVNRYGSGGRFTKRTEGAKPVRFWQVWNEPNIYGFWRPRPKPSAYAELLRLGARAIRSADRRAKIVLGGLPPTRRGIDPDVYLDALLNERRVKRHFDLAAVHPYAQDLGEMLERVEEVRQVLNRNGLRGTELMVTEFGWGSDGYPHTEIQTPQGQAGIVRASLASLEARRDRWGIKRIFWFAWRDREDAPEACFFCFATGLIGTDGEGKPSWYEFRAAASGE